MIGLTFCLSATEKGLPGFTSDHSKSSPYWFIKWTYSKQTFGERIGVSYVLLASPGLTQPGGGVNVVCA